MSDKLRYRRYKLALTMTLLSQDLDSFSFSELSPCSPVGSPVITGTPLAVPSPETLASLLASPVTRSLSSSQAPFLTTQMAWQLDFKLIIRGVGGSIWVLQEAVLSMISSATCQKSHLVASPMLQLRLLPRLSPAERCLPHTNKWANTPHG